MFFSICQEQSVGKNVEILLHKGYTVLAGASGYFK